MALKVLKFGGTSVGTPEKIKSIAKRISKWHAQGSDLLVVVSAMGHTTDQLTDLALQVSQTPPSREMDMLLTAGERISMALLSMALTDLGVPAVSFTGSQSGIITDGSHQRAKIQYVLGDRLKEVLAQRKVAIVAGFQGVSENKEITTLGRGGSDTSAVALAVALKAEFCDIYTDVAGVYSADPQVVPRARLFDQISYETMLELAYLGAQILHPRGVALAQKYQIDLWVKNAHSNEKGTQITMREKIESPRFRAVTADSNHFWIEVELARDTVLGALLEEASHRHWNVLYPQYEENRIQFFAERSCLKDWKKHLERLVAQEFVKKFELHEEKIPVSLVGDALPQEGSLLTAAIETLSLEKIPVARAFASAQAITLILPKNRADDAVRVLHHRWVEAES